MAQWERICPQCRRHSRKCGFSSGLGRPPGEGNGYHSGVLTWRIPWTEEPAGLQSMGSQKSWAWLSTSMHCPEGFCMEGGHSTLAGCLMKVTCKWLYSCGGKIPINSFCNNSSAYKVMLEWLIAFMGRNRRPLFSSKTSESGQTMAVGRDKYCTSSWVIR